MTQAYNSCLPLTFIKKKTIYVYDSLKFQGSVEHGGCVLKGLLSKKFVHCIVFFLSLIAVVRDFMRYPAGTMQFMKMAVIVSRNRIRHLLSLSYTE